MLLLGSSQAFLTVHLNQQLVESLLLLCIREARHVRGALLPHRIDLIDVNDAGRSAASLFEQTSHPGCTQTYAHDQAPHSNALLAACVVMTVCATSTAVGVFKYLR